MNLITIKIEQLFKEGIENNAILHSGMFNDTEIAAILKECKADFSKNKIKPVSINGLYYKIFYFKHRPLRGYLKKGGLLDRLGIINIEAESYYEVPSSDSPDFLSYVPKKDLPKEASFRTASIFPNYNEDPNKNKNPKGKFFRITLHAQDRSASDFNITPNWAPFCPEEKEHFIVVSAPYDKKALRQIFHTNRTLYWIDDLMSQLNSCEYSGFFNITSYSMDTLHYQLLKTKLPVFDRLGVLYPDKTILAPIKTTKSDWVFPGILCRYNDQSKKSVLARFEKMILKWQSENSQRTFDILFHITDDGYREFYCIFRDKDLIYIKPGNVKAQITMAGLETSGIIIVESSTIFKAFPEIIADFKLEKRE